MQRKSTTKETMCIICKEPAVRDFFCPCDLTHSVCGQHEPTDCAWASQHPDYVRAVVCDPCGRYVSPRHVH